MKQKTTIEVTEENGSVNLVISGRTLDRNEILALAKFLAEDAGYNTGKYSPCVGRGILIYDKI